MTFSFISKRIIFLIMYTFLDNKILPNEEVESNVKLCKFFSIINFKTRVLKFPTNRVNFKQI